MTDLLDRPRYARLDAAHNLVYIHDIDEWARSFNADDRRVAQTALRNLWGTKIVISTVFLGLDHGFGGASLWFETMVFVNSFSDVECVRYATWDEAAAGHAQMVSRWKWKRYYYPLAEAWGKLSRWKWKRYYYPLAEAWGKLSRCVRGFLG